MTAIMLYLLLSLLITFIQEVQNYRPTRNVSRDSSVGIANRYGLEVRDRIPVEVRLSALIQTGLGAHSTSYTMGTGSFPGIKQQRRGVDHPTTSPDEVKERVELYICSHSLPS
jgi:hypothetical protein